MSATIGDFYQRVSRAIRRRTLYDDDIPGYAADAVRELENSHNWKYMLREYSWVLNSSTTNNTINLLISNLGGGGGGVYPPVKSVRYMSFVSDNGERIPVKKTQRENVTQIASGRPGAFWMIDKDTIGLDAYPNQTYSYEIGLFRHSARPLVDNLDWLTIGEDLLIARTIRKMQPILRDDNLIKRCSEIENSTLPALLEAEVVSEHDAEDSQMTPFTYEIEEDLAKLAVFT